MNNDTKYIRMKENGATATEVYLQAREDEVSYLNAMVLIRRTFELSLMEAKEVVHTASGKYKSLAEYQAIFLDPLRQALEEMEREENEQSEE